MNEGGTVLRLSHDPVTVFSVAPLLASPSEARFVLATDHSEARFVLVRHGYAGESLTWHSRDQFPPRIAHDSLAEYFATPSSRAPDEFSAPRLLASVVRHVATMLSKCAFD